MFLDDDCIEMVFKSTQIDGTSKFVYQKHTIQTTAPSRPVNQAANETWIVSNIEKKWVVFKHRHSLILHKGLP